MGPDRLGNGPGYRHRAPLGPEHPRFGMDPVRHRRCLRRCVLESRIRQGYGSQSKRVQSKKRLSFKQTKEQNQRSPPSTDHFPTCVGPNIHGGAEAWRAGRLDVLDLFASFWIKPKRRGTVLKHNRSVQYTMANQILSSLPHGPP